MKLAAITQNATMKAMIIRLLKKLKKISITKKKKLDLPSQAVTMNTRKANISPRTEGKASMKTTITKIEKATILTWKRERNTVYGNPVFSFTITDEAGKVYSGKTRPNAGFVYGLCSYPEALAYVTISITPSDRVYMDQAIASK